MFDTVLTYATNGVVVGAVCLTLGVVFGQKIKDFLAGVPKEARAAADALVVDVKGKLATAKQDVLAKVAPVVLKPVSLPAPAPVAPAVPAVPVVAVVVPPAVEPAAHA